MFPNMFPEPCEIIDISQPIDAHTACFPGDVPFSKRLTVDFKSSGVINLTAFEMSPHVGTHADAPVHIQGDLSHPTQESHLPIGQQTLSSYIGLALVVDLAPFTSAITWDALSQRLGDIQSFPSRILFKTRTTLRYNVFEDDYAYLSPCLVEALAQRKACLVGLDTPSVDHVDSKSLEAHHALHQAGMVWLENLDFSRLELPSEKAAVFFLSALPLRFNELEASPVRAVLLRF